MLYKVEEAARIKVEMRAAVEEAHITIYSLQLNQRDKPPRIRRRGSKRRGGSPWQRQITPKCRGGKRRELVQFMRK